MLLRIKASENEVFFPFFSYDVSILDWCTFYLQYFAIVTIFTINAFVTILCERFSSYMLHSVGPALEGTGQSFLNNIVLQNHLGVSNGEGNGTPLQCSCLENPMGRGALWAAVHGVAKSRTQLSDFTFNFSLSGIGEGNGNPLQCSCLENPRDGGAWWAAVYGVAQS